MERFVKRHQDRIRGIIAGLDRVLFRGTLRSISYVRGMQGYLASRRILYKDYGAFACAVTERLRETAKQWAQQQGRPYYWLESSRISKENFARSIAERDGVREGLICVLGAMEPCRTIRVGRNRERQRLELREQSSKCSFLYFYFLDPQFGFLHVRLQTWLPCPIQVCVNGREWLARQLDRAGIEYTRQRNCFTHIARLSRAQQLMEELTQMNWKNQLNCWATTMWGWIQGLLGADLRGYYWSVRESEYATDVMFDQAADLQAIYPRLVEHGIQCFHSEDVLRFLGHRQPGLFRGRVETSLRKRCEGVRLKHFVDENSLKMYDKAGSVLRVETTINNPRRFKVRRMGVRQGQRSMAWQPLRKGVADLRRRVEICRGANRRYLEALAAVDEDRSVSRVLDPVSQPLCRKNRRYRALRPLSPEESQRCSLLLRGEWLIEGFRNKSLQAWWEALPASAHLNHKQIAARITRWLSLLRAHRLICRLPQSHRYRLTERGRQVLTTALQVRSIQLPLLTPKCCHTSKN